MGKTKKKQPVWIPFLMGALLSLGIYLAGHLLLALLLVKGTVGEGTAFPATAVLCVLSSTAGALLPARRCVWGALPGGVLAAGLFCCVLIFAGALWWDGISWTGRGGILLLCALGGGVLAALAGTSGRKRKKRHR